MKLIMAGLDHRSASLEIREKFSFTKDRAGRALEYIRAGGGVGGCVIISTCNRAELYASVHDGHEFNPTRALCETFGLCFATYGRFLAEKSGVQALGHLCRMASGMDSLVAGDDQAITQAREALEFSRMRGYTDSYTETMFKTAIKAAKTIKTEVILRTLGVGSVPEKAIAMLKASYPLAGKKAIVIGNGQMGRLVAELLIKEKSIVTVTLREYKKGHIQVPNHAGTIGYSERYKAIEGADIVVSATASPHFTIRLDDLKGLTPLPGVFVDLAVPRDIEPSVRGLDGAALYTVDDIPGGGRSLPPQSIARIDEIIAGHIEKYYRWISYKENAGAAAAENII